MQRHARLEHDPRGLIRSLRTTGLAEQPDLRPRLGAVGIPVTLMAGEEDPKFTALAEETAALLPRARVVVVPEAGHNLLLERPEAVAEELNRNIR
jgi:pimeloyl-ACP methyl ester carboxylesterase